MFLLPARALTQPMRIADLAAVVTVTDDGGSSGRLRQDFNMLPPGDLRNCMVALSEEEDLLSRLFTHRFRGGNGLKGHNFGNLFVAALTEITGDFAQAVQLASKILATRGRIYPATTANATLVANMDDGSVVRGETKITASKRRIVELDARSAESGSAAGDAGGDRARRPDHRGAGLAVHFADHQSAGGWNSGSAGERRSGVRVYICNLMTQANESLGLTASRAHRAHLRAHAHADLRLRDREHGDSSRRRRWRATRPRARRRSCPISSASKRWACAASPAILPAKRTWFATLRIA